MGGAAAVALWLPQQRAKRRATNESNAWTALRTLASAEADYRLHDRDGNKINDFWTGDLAELYRLGLIERGVADADTQPLNPLVPAPIPFHGYYFQALRIDNSVTPPETYGQDTDEKFGKVHNLERFGFVAYPADSDGLSFLIINENNSVFRAAATISRPTDWPTTAELRSSWGRPD